MVAMSSQSQCVNPWSASSVNIRDFEWSPPNQMSCFLKWYSYNRHIAHQILYGVKIRLRLPNGIIIFQNEGRDITQLKSKR